MLSVCESDLLKSAGSSGGPLRAPHDRDGQRRVGLQLLDRALDREPERRHFRCGGSIRIGDVVEQDLVSCSDRSTPGTARASAAPGPAPARREPRATRRHSRAASDVACAPPSARIGDELRRAPSSAWIWRTESRSGAGFSATACCLSRGLPATVPPRVRHSAAPLARRWCTRRPQ